MRMKLPRERGRPRGKYRSLADLRRIQYLALISMKYGTDSEKLFNSFVKAWKHQESICKSLLIECRKKTRNDAIFLITESCKVVAQFSLPTHILGEVSPLKDFVYPKGSRRKKVEGTASKNLQIRDLKSGMKRINLKARVLEISKPRSVVTRFGGFATVTNVSISDETGIIQLSLWNNQINTVSVGNILQVENARVVSFRGELQLRVGKSGHVSVVKKSDVSLKGVY